MGLDTSFHRIPRELGEGLVDESGNIDFWDGRAHGKEVLYFRKNFPMQNVLGEVFPDGYDLCYVPISKLRAYHILHRLQHDRIKDCAWSRNRARDFVNKFEALLNDFDFDRWMLAYCYSH